MSDTNFNIAGVNDLRRHIAPLHDELTEAADRVISSGWFVLGREVESFETQFAAYCNVAHGIGVANGTERRFRAERPDRSERSARSASILQKIWALSATGARS